ncbi:sentrin-specific protease 8-like [Pollicipes pollicipes]|uniref:sentrin-specific protease 8-like n=1 Tax=Pollicipes pollicipes TaxID=41117 RepID=UPI0018849DCA|nr:sentrin-specific protease 8-like [Pollicipes pollicipes]XP_037094719.1 sentrin-specific protease 8-like [Pollicipes pollicipes]XP_037094755.1 sentrin-specific protease 8-like [Pollicipes pollicipes]
MAEPVLLSYHDSVLHESDGELLQGPHWLNDKLIQFYLNYLEHAAFPAAGLAFVGPDVTQFARLCAESELAAFLAPLRLAERRAALFIINDCERPDAPGGTHWSLLVTVGRRCLHYDSLAYGNQREARRMARRLAPLLGLSGKVEEAACGCQRNGYDCGVFALCHAEEVARRLSGGSDLRHVPVSQERVDEMRADMLRLIRSLAAR